MACSIRRSSHLSSIGAEWKPKNKQNRNEMKRKRKKPSQPTQRQKTSACKRPTIRSSSLNYKKRKFVSKMDNVRWSEHILSVSHRINAIWMNYIVIVLLDSWHFFIFYFGICSLRPVSSPLSIYSQTSILFSSASSSSSSFRCSIRKWHRQRMRLTPTTTVRTSNEPPNRREIIDRLEIFGHLSKILCAVFINYL